MAQYARFLGNNIFEQKLLIDQKLTARIHLIAPKISPRHHKRRRDYKDTSPGILIRVSKTVIIFESPKLAMIR